MKLRHLIGTIIAGADFLKITNDGGDTEKIYDTEITSIVTDSRRAEAGSLFICIKGTKSDGHDFITEAVERGAAFVIVEAGNEHKITAETAYAVAASTRKAESLLWDAWYAHPSAGMKIIAVTGTNGKTSTSYILRAIMKRAGYKTALIGTVRSLIGDDEYDMRGGSAMYGGETSSAMTTPDPEILYGAISEMRERGTEVIIMEASSHAIELEKLAGLASCGKIDAGIFTNLSPEHLDFHGSMENYAKAKAKLFSMCKTGIINGDSEYANDIENFSHQFGGGDEGCKFVRFSSRSETIVNHDITYTAVNVKSNGTDGVEYILYSDKGVFEVASPIPGMFTVYNTLAAISCAVEFGIGRDIIADAVKNLQGVDGRIERVTLGEDVDFSVFIDYAHTPAALESMLCVVRGFRKKGQKITLVFGCGGDRDPAKRKVMGAIASRLADFVIVTSDNARSESPRKIILEILKGIDKEKPHIALENRADAIEYAVTTAKKNDIIILAGKGHERYEIDKDGKHPFDEAEIVRKSTARTFKNN